MNVAPAHTFHIAAYLEHHLKENWQKRTHALKRRNTEMDNVELPLADKLADGLGLGVHVERQVSCPGGRVDVLTPDEIFECKATGDEHSIFNAARQLRRYARYFRGRALWIVVPFIEDDAKWLRAAFRTAGIEILELDFEP